MNANQSLNPAEREFLMRLRSLLLMCIDLIERRAQVGKYRPARPAPYSPTQTVASAATFATADTVTHDQTSDTLPTV